MIGVMVGSPRQRRSRRRASLLPRLDALLRRLYGISTEGATQRPYPAEQAAADRLGADERRQAGALMRVNHAGEVCAQALYRGQALVAGRAETRELLRNAAAEEGDHLLWCRRRLLELGSEPSRLGPLWYLGSFCIGMAAGLAGERRSLGFMMETEAQVVRHLRDHLQRLPAADARSRAVLQQMCADEAEHGDTAGAAGAEPPPPPLRRLMWLCSRVMTTTAARL